MDNIQLAFEKEYKDLFDTNKYIAKSDYAELKKKYAQFSHVLEAYSRLEFDVDLHNERFIKSKLGEYVYYFDSLFYDIDKNIKLDEEQRRVVLTDEDYCLVIAGAGAGKTTTMAAKVKYLVEKLAVAPEEIILISFTNKAVDELKERINDKLGINVKVTTFHSFGYELLRSIYDIPPGINITSYNILLSLFDQRIYRSGSLLRKLILFFGCYFDLPEIALGFENLEQYHAYRAEKDYETLKSSLGEYNRNIIDRRSRYVRTIKGEYLRSMQEVQIANFLYLNGIEYEYEKPYEYVIDGGRKPYTPDFYIVQGDNHCYLEHFGLTEDGRSGIYSPRELVKYLKGINFKRRLHEQNNSPLITTFASYNDGRPLIDHLSEELKRKGFVLNPRNDEETYRKLVETGKDKYIIRFILLTIEFIKRFKTNGMDINSFAWLKRKTDNVRTRLFLEIVEEVYSLYQNELNRTNTIDFEDMINEAEKALRRMEEQGYGFKCKYIIIDEYQDIARQRFNLTKQLADVTGAKVVAVGDDWQSIFAFSGSDITLFTRFLKLMGQGKELQITHTYRNSQELIDIAGGFVQRNPSQIRKRLVSPKHIDRPVIISTYDDSKSMRKNRINEIVNTIGEVIREYGKRTSILLLGRYGFDEHFLLQSGLFVQLPGGKLRCEKYPYADVTCMTAHSSKGLGYDNVIIINAMEGKYGFPSQIEDDPVMKLVTVEDGDFGFAEERRLFYVALTRTKNRVYIVAPAGRPSRFIAELIKEYGVEKPPKLNMGATGESGSVRNKCPVCGFPLKYTFNKSIGLDLWICTNEPEVCDFMTNDRKAMGDIFICPECYDGYMIVKKSRNSDNRFFGCTNHKPDGTGCNHVQMIL